RRLSRPASDFDSQASQLHLEKGAAPSICRIRRIFRSQPKVPRWNRWLYGGDCGFLEQEDQGIGSEGLGSLRDTILLLQLFHSSCSRHGQAIQYLIQLA
ncbi:hypothetical protein LINPERHAP1_LOCUS18508, partial [Linum perenne]